MNALQHIRTWLEELKRAEACASEIRGKELNLGNEEAGYLNPPPTLAVGDWVKFMDMNRGVQSSTVTSTTLTGLNTEQKRHGFVASVEPGIFVRGDYILEHRKKEEGEEGNKMGEAFMNPPPTLKEGDWIEFCDDATGAGKRSGTVVRPKGYSLYSCIVQLDSQFMCGWLGDTIKNCWSVQPNYITKHREAGSYAPNSTVTGGSSTTNQGEKHMVFNVLVTRKVMKFNTERTESTQVERVLVASNNVVAPNSSVAALIVGRQLPTTVSDEDLSTADIKVTQVS